MRIALAAAVAAAACTPVVNAENPSPSLAFLGDWDCGVAIFTFTADTYSPGAGAEPLPILSVESRSVGNYIVTFPDDYSIALYDVTTAGMVWSSPSTGDTFDCVRVTA